MSSGPGRRRVRTGAVPHPRGRLCCPRRWRGTMRREGKAAPGAPERGGGSAPAAVAAPVPGNRGLAASLRGLGQGVAGPAATCCRHSALGRVGDRCSLSRGHGPLSPPGPAHPSDPGATFGVSRGGAASPGGASRDCHGGAAAGPPATRGAGPGLSRALRREGPLADTASDGCGAGVARGGRGPPARLGRPGQRRLQAGGTVGSCRGYRDTVALLPGPSTFVFVSRSEI